MNAIDFNNKVVQNSEGLRNVAFNLTRDEDDANDLVQETVLRALTSMDKFRAGTNLKAWMYTIMKNIFINNYRRKVKRKTMVDTTDNNYYINSTDRSIVNGGEASLEMQDIYRALDGLNEEFRIPFLMHYKGFKYKEIADDLELPIGTIKSRIHFARKELKSSLKRY